MKTTTQILKEMLMRGEKVDKFDFLKQTNSVCLAQRILDLKREGWHIQSQIKEGKGTLTEYWLTPEEIERLKKPIQEPLFTGLWG